MSRVLTPPAPSAEDIRTWLGRQRQLLELERNTERDQSALLRTQCAPRLLERHGLALLGLGVASVRVGQGAKLCVTAADTGLLSSKDRLHSTRVSTCRRTRCVQATRSSC